MLFREGNQSIKAFLIESGYSPVESKSFELVDDDNKLPLYGNTLVLWFTKVFQLLYEGKREVVSFYSMILCVFVCIVCALCKTILDLPLSIERKQQQRYHPTLLEPSMPPNKYIVYKRKHKYIQLLIHLQTQKYTHKMT